MPIALLAFRVPSEPCFTGRGKSAGLLPGALRAASDENIDRAAAPAYSVHNVGLGGHWLFCFARSNVAAMILLTCRPFTFGI